MRKIFGLLVYLGILGGLMLSVEAQIIRPTPTPILPSTESCVTAGDYYQLPASSLKLVDLKAVQISAAVMLGGRLSPLSVGECSGIKGLDIIIPWSESTAETLAAITWSRIVCNGLPPQKVSITLSHGTALTLVAYNEKGVVVDKLSTRAASTAAVTYSLSSEDGIRRIEMVGAEICISRICWLCRIPVDEPTPTPTPTLTPTPTPIPSDYTCINPSQFLQLNQSSDTFSLNAITVHAALDASGAVVPLTTANCTDDKRTSIFIPWSEDTAGQLASIEFSEKLCNGLLPTEVQLIVRHGNHAKFIAYDSAGTIVDSQAAADDSSIQTITLKSPTGIRLIEIIGSEICLIDICWRCEPYEEPVQKAEWVPIDPNARPGQPIQVVVESANESETQLVLKIPGFWRTLVKYGGRVFTKIEFPRVGSLAGSGFSEGKEWFQFPSRLTAPSLSSSRYSNALAIRINQPIFPA
ncbi:MAG: hypothetical protein RBU29_14590, partial [bacterium]|nr:hypothetical protein [bacterium]